MKRITAIGAILLTALAVVACGGGGGSDHNAQDVSFAKDMVPHHQQAVMMSDMAQAQTTNPQVLDLASRIKAAQTTEISLMNGWLASWGEQATDHSGHDMGSMKSMNGMVSDDGMQSLRGASGPQFDKMFLEDMTAHHQGALEMAGAQIAKGKFGPAKGLAQEITTGQKKEIAEMAQLLKAPATATP